MIRAASLIYAVFISLIIALISSAFILNTYHHQQYIASINSRDQVLADSYSGIRLLLANQEQVRPGETVLMDLYEDESHPVQLKRKSWGVYEVLEATAKRKNYISKKIALSGANTLQGEEVALYLSDINKPLGLCGKTMLKGNCYLPKSGVKRTYIEGQHFVGNELVQGTIKNSGTTLPALNDALLEVSSYYLSATTRSGDSLVYFDEMLETDSIVHSFDKSTLLIHSDLPIRLSQLFLKGNIIIRSDERIEIEKSCQLEDVLIYAPQILVKEQFKGNVQLYASDSISIASACSLFYPSSVALINNRQREKDFEVMIHQDAVVEGAVFVQNKYPSRKSRALLTIKEQAVVRGEVYCNDYLELTGKVEGSVYCRRFVLKTPSSVYENHLLNATIDRSKLSPHYVGIPLLQTTYPKKIVKWLD